ncbi:hypothetical protein QUA82_25555 [Microcoleus sp. F8-D3]
MRLAVEGGFVKRNQVAKVATAKTEAKLKVKKVSNADIRLFQLGELRNLATNFYISIDRAFQPIAHKVFNA